LDASTGNKIWSYKTGQAVESTPSFANGVIYIGSMDNNVYAFGSIAVPQPSPSMSSLSPMPAASSSPTPSSNQEIFPVAPISAASIALIVVTAGAGLLLYFQKRHRVHVWAIGKEIEPSIQ
jgi:hypothetical protein